MIDEVHILGVLHEGHAQVLEAVQSISLADILDDTLEGLFLALLNHEV